MKRAEAEKLLGGYATGTLTETERKLLFEAALGDQGLFDALADEEALRELLADPRARRRLLEALAERRAPAWARLAQWWRRPVAWGVAGSVAVAAMLVVMLVPVVRTVTQKPAAEPLAQAPVEMAKKVEPATPLPAAPPAAAPVLRRTRAAERAEPPVAAPAPAEPVAEQQVAQRTQQKGAVAEVQVSPPPAVEAQARPAQAEALVAAAPPPPPVEKEAVAAKSEVAKVGVVGGVPAPAATMAAVELDARALYYAAGAERKDMARTALAVQRARRAADEEAPRGGRGPAPGVVSGLRYSILKLTPGGVYAAADPESIFAPGDVIRFSVEASQGGVIRLMRQGQTVAEVALEERVRQVVPAEGLRLKGPEKLSLEFRPAGSRAAPAGKPRIQKAAEEHAVYVVQPGGGPLRVEIELRGR